MKIGIHIIRVYDKYLFTELYKPNNLKTYPADEYTKV